MLSEKVLDIDAYNNIQMDYQLISKLGIHRCQNKKCFLISCNAKDLGNGHFSKVS